jgi:hypothetical protein
MNGDLHHKMAVTMDALLDTYVEFGDDEPFQPGAKPLALGNSITLVQRFLSVD